MKKQTILIVITAIIIGVIGFYSITNKDSEKINAPIMMNSEMGQMDHSMMMVSSEKEFIEGMIPHHQEAVDTAKQVIERGGTTPEIIELVENIVVAQEKEIVQMKQWYIDWYGEEYSDNSKYVPMMRELENLSGKELDRVFLQDMIGHHMGAIMMARSVQTYITQNEIDNLVQDIISSQSSEIVLIRQILKEL